MYLFLFRSNFGGVFFFNNMKNYEEVSFIKLLFDNHVSRSNVKSLYLSKSFNFILSNYLNLNLPFLKGSRLVYTNNFNDFVMNVERFYVGQNYRVFCSAIKFYSKFISLKLFNQSYLPVLKTLQGKPFFVLSLPCRPYLLISKSLIFVLNRQGFLKNKFIIS